MPPLKKLSDSSYTKKGGRVKLVDSGKPGPAKSRAVGSVTGSLRYGKVMTGTYKTPVSPKPTPKPGDMSKTRGGGVASGGLARPTTRGSRKAPTKGY